MNMQNLMAQAQKMQKDIQKKKDEIDNTIFEASNDLVEVKYNGKKELLAIKIKENIDDLEMLEDMIVLASKDAVKQIDEMIENKLGSINSSLGGLF